MKNKKVIFLVLGGVVLLIVSLLLIFTKAFTQPLSIFNTTLKETSSNTATISQAFTYVAGYTGDLEEDGTPDYPVMQYSTTVNILTNKDIKKFEIKNVQLSNSIDSSREYVTWPKHFKKISSSNLFYEEMGVLSQYTDRQDEGRNFSYVVVDNPEYADEMGINGGYVDFKYTMYWDDRTFDYEGILDRDGVFNGGSVFKYGELTKVDIESPIEFDVVITYVDNSKAIKHFKLTTNFDQVAESSFSFENNSSEYVGISF